MSAEQVLCEKCGQPFVSGKIFQHIIKVAVENNLERFRDSFSLCQKCKRETFSQKLIGENLAIVPRVNYVAKRRSEPIETVRRNKKTGVTVYKSQCYNCNSGCEANVWVKNGEVIKVEGDPSSVINKGTLCAKGLASKYMLYHPDRLRYPMKRAGARGEGKWQRISWDEALDTIAAELKKTEQKYGKDSVVLATGTARGWMATFWRFANAYGKQWTGPGIAQCAYPRRSASIMVTGGNALEAPDYDHTQCMIIWGGNPPATWPKKALGMMEAKGRGAKLIVVDPILTETSSKADIWLKLRPGTDAALALGMLNVIISEELYDKEFVAKWCLGFDELKERVREYPLEKVENITWVPQARIIEAARLYAKTRPASITQILAIEQNADTISTARAIAMLASITGNIDIPGGNIFTMPPPIMGGEDYGMKNTLTKEQHEKRLGSREYPLLAGEACILSPSTHNASLWKAMLTGDPYPVRALYCQGNNMVVDYADTKLVTEALLSLDFFAVVDIFPTPTTELADIVLPAATWMERDYAGTFEQVSYNSVIMQQKVVEIDECWTDFKILGELAERLGFGDLMWKDDVAHCNYILEPSGMTWEEFKKKGIITVPLEYRKYEKDGFQTPSRKIELYSQLLKDLGFDPLPVYREPTESPVSNPELAKEYPLILTTGAREPVFRHSELRNIPLLREIWPDPKVKIHPSIAREHGIEEGDVLIVETPRGSMEAKAWLREDIDPRVVQVPSHWAGKNNVNLITDSENCATMIGSTQLRCQLCRVRKGE